MTDDLELRPIPEASLPPAVVRILGSPQSAKLMAAKGIAPLRPAELAIAVYQLSFDPDATVKATAEAAPSTLPDKVLVPALGEQLPPVVLHFFAEKLAPSRAEPHARILYNRAASDHTFATLARKLDERELEIIVHNEERMLRFPAIVEALYFNKKARMSSVNRAIELCARNGIRLDALPAYEDIARSIGADPQATDPAVADVVFNQVLQETEKAEALGEPSPLDLGGAAGPAASIEIDAKDASSRKAVIDFTKLKLHEKIRLATLGNAYCRGVLLRDSNRMVAMAAIRSPQITDQEIVRASGNRAISEDVIRYIANQRDMVKLYPVKLNLVQNPKCPIGISMRLLTFLHAEDLKTMSRSKNIPSALSTIAKKLVAQRTKSS